MARYTLTIPESKTEQVLAYLKSLRGVKVEEADDQEELVIHNWQKNILDQRLKSVKNHPEKLITEKQMHARIKKHL
jgi:hypothetical protein